MGRLFLLRHAKASWADPGTRDFDRGLEPSGRNDAEAVGRTMTERGYLPVRVVCSTARRARETWTEVRKTLRGGGESVLLTETLYSADSAGYLEIIRESGNPAALLIVGHNPMVEDVAMALCAPSDDHARHLLGAGFPTAGLAVIDFPDGLSAASPGSGQLFDFLTPQDN